MKLSPAGFEVPCMASRHSVCTRGQSDEAVATFDPVIRRTTVWVEAGGTTMPASEVLSPDDALSWVCSVAAHPPKKAVLALTIRIGSSRLCIWVFRVMKSICRMELQTLCRHEIVKLEQHPPLSSFAGYNDGTTRNRPHQQRGRAIESASAGRVRYGDPFVARISGLMPESAPMPCRHKQ